MGVRIHQPRQHSLPREVYDPRARGDNHIRAYRGYFAVFDKDDLICGCFSAIRIYNEPGANCYSLTEGTKDTEKDEYESKKWSAHRSDHCMTATRD
jgi:hypothetical protein